MVNGSKSTPNDGYEIKVSGKKVLYIRDLRDRSVIQIAWEQVNTAANQKYGYQLHIYLEPGSSGEINLKDPVEIAWLKMQASHIYQWVGETKDKEKWKTLLGKKISYALEALKIQEQK